MENLLRVVTYNRDQEEAPKKRKLRRKTEALVAALQACKVQDPRGASASCYQCGKPGHFKKECPNSKRKTPQPCPACGGDHWRSNCPRRRRSLGSEPVSQMAQQDSWVPELKPQLQWLKLPLQHRSRQVILEIEGRKAYLLLNSRASLFLFSPL